MPRYPDSDAALDRALDRAPGERGGAALNQTLSLSRDWLARPDTLTLNPSYELTADDLGTRIRARLGDHRLFLDEPVLLAPVLVAKPWGREIWHTGIEARGESRISTPAGELPLSQYLALAPRRLCRRAPLVLLKVLDPRPEPVLGDLYFEAHEEKQEVYVVTHVDQHAWPGGGGGIRFGMNQDLRRQYADDRAFRHAYLKSVQAYEQVRRSIDAGTGIEPHQEAQLRAAMDAFTHLRALRVGDVVVVPTWLPHSLQHGVRVIEFQTPSYERYIISFAQKVLTQDHWDSERAIARMRLDAPPAASFERLGDGVERIVAFDEFQVWRVSLEPGDALTLPAHPSYALCMGVHGTVTLGPLMLGPEQAAFVPAAALAEPRRHRHARLANPGDQRATLLVAAPDL